MASRSSALSSLLRLQPVRGQLAHQSSKLARSFTSAIPTQRHHSSSSSLYSSTSYASATALVRRAGPSLPFLLPPSASAILGVRSYSSRKGFKPMTAHGARPDSRAKKEGLGPSVRLGTEDLAAQEDQLERQGGIPLFPHTFIMPTGKNLPGLFDEPKLRWKLEWRRIRSAILKPSQYWYYRWKHSIKLKKASSIRADALVLYKQMYTAYARGDISALQRICVPELAENFRRQIAARNERSVMAWKFHDLLSVSISSDLTIPLPQGLIVRQVVVKIVSRQSLTRFKKKKAADVPGKKTWNEYMDYEGESEPKVMTEYFVLNQLNVEKSQDKWKVWGTTEETDAKGLLQIERIESMEKTGEKIEV